MDATWLELVGLMAVGLNQRQGPGAENRPAFFYALPETIKE